MVVYPCDIQNVYRLLTGKKGQLKKEVPSVAMMTNFGFGPWIYLILGIPSLWKKPAHHSLCFSLYVMHIELIMYRFSHFESDSVTTWLSLPEDYLFFFPCLVLHREYALSVA